MVMQYSPPLRRHLRLPTVVEVGLAVVEPVMVELLVEIETSLSTLRPLVKDENQEKKKRLAE